MKEEILSAWAALPCLDTSHTQTDQEDHQAQQAGDDGCHGDAVGVLHQDGQSDDSKHVDDGPDGDGEPGDGDDCDPDGEDGGENIAPCEY